MKTIETVVYTFDELSDEAKAKARDWWLEGQDNSFAWENTIEDALQIGLIIEELNDHRANEGHFVTTALNCAKAIISDHGDTCETHKTAKKFIAEYNKVMSDLDESDEFPQDAINECNADFLQALLEDYRIMYNKDCEHQQSDEYIAEIMDANEYTFTEDGKRFG